MQSSPSLPRPSDRWIPWYFVAFFILLILILVPMCILAVRTNTGVVTDNAYEKGLAYNKTIHAAEQQAALKWHGDLAVDMLPENGIKMSLVLTDAAGKALSNAEVKCWFARPTQAGMDQNIVMKPLADGHYNAELLLPMRGLWEAHVSATTEGQNYQMVRRIVLP